LETKTLYEKYGFIIYGRCVRILHSKEEAQDAFHDIFLKFIKKYPEFKNKEHIIPWIITVSKNHCFTILRQQKKFIKEVEMEHLHSSEQLDKEIANRDIIDKVMQIHDKKVQSAVYYTYVEELNQEEIYSITGQSPATIRRHLKYFKERLPFIHKRIGL